MNFSKNINLLNKLINNNYYYNILKHYLNPNYIS